MDRLKIGHKVKSCSFIVLRSMVKREGMLQRSRHDETRDAAHRGNDLRETWDNSTKVASEDIGHERGMCVSSLHTSTMLLKKSHESRKQRLNLNRIG